MAVPKPKNQIARKLTIICPDPGKERRAESMVWGGRKIPLLLEDGLWRARKRSKWLTVDIASGTPNLADARKIIREALEKRAKNPQVSAVKSHDTLEDVVQIYLAAPKRISAANGEANVQRLRSVVKTAWGKELKQVKLADLPKLWSAYAAKRQGRDAPDYNTRSPMNKGINSAMRLSRSIFIPKLAAAYEAAGILLPPNAATVTWLPEGYAPPAEVDDAGLIAAWRGLERGPLWFVVGLARFAGLRRSEILAMRGKWVPGGTGATVIELRDRPEDKYYTKTGRPYSALVLDAELSAALRTIEKEAMVVVMDDAERWIERAPQQWLEPFTGKARLPLHRLRGLYADQVRIETESAVLARQEAIKAASKALGHTNVATTTGSYLTPARLAVVPSVSIGRPGGETFTA